MSTDEQRLTDLEDSVSKAAVAMVRLQNMDDLNVVFARLHKTVQACQRSEASIIELQNELDGEMSLLRARLAE